MNFLEPMAEAGDPYVQFLIGFMYQHGYGRKKSIGEALEWYLRAANGNLPIAQYALGLLLKMPGTPKGLLEGKDQLSGDEWIARSADAGFAPALFSIGLVGLHENKEEVDKETRSRAIGSIRRASEANYAPAFRTMARLIGGENYPERDVEESKNYRQKAAELGDGISAFKLGFALLKDESAENRELGLYWLTKAAAYDNFMAYAELSSIFRRGLHGFKKSKDLAALFDELHNHSVRRFDP